MICNHARICTAEVSDDRIPYIFLMCKLCGVEIARWKKAKDDKINFEELFYQHLYIFGPVPELDWKLRHDLR